MLKSIFSVSAMTLLSRIFGFVRDVLMAGLFGAGGLSDAFFVAFRLPNMFRSLLAEGAFNNAFVPIFSKKIQQDGREKATIFSGQVLTLMIVLGCVLSAVFMWQMPAVMTILAKGYVNTPEFSMIVQAGRIVFPYLIFVMVMAQLAGMLNSIQKFWGASFAPVLFNVVFVGVLFFVMQTVGMGNQPTPDHLLMVTYGVLVAGSVQILWIGFYAHRVGILPRLRLPQWTPSLKRLLTVMAPGTLGAGVYHVNLIFSTMFATMVGAGSVSYLSYAERLFQLPIGLIGVAISVVLLPTLSKQLSAGETANALDTQNRALELGMILAIPATGAMIVMAYPLIAGLFMRDNFSPVDAHNTAVVLSMMAFGVPAYILLKILTPSFYARHDTRTPVVYSAISVLVNVTLAWLLLSKYHLQGIVMAGVMAVWLNAILVILTLMVKKIWYPDRACLGRLLKVLLCTGVMMLCVYGVGVVMTAIPPLFVMMGQIITGLCVYATLVVVTKTITKSYLVHALKKS